MALDERANNVALSGARTLIAGASSGIGRAFALAAGRRGARVAVAARRTELLTSLADEIGGVAYQLDITDPMSIDRLVNDAAEELGGIDILVCTCGVLPFARVEHIDHSTWAEAFAVNTVGPTLLVSAALPRLSEGAVVLVVTSDEERRTRTGTAAYSASKVALDEILRSWRNEHPSLRLMRVALSPTSGTEILRGADRELLEELLQEWTRQAQIPTEFVAVNDIAEALVDLVGTAFANPGLLTENVRLASHACSTSGDAEPVQVTDAAARIAHGPNSIRTN